MSINKPNITFVTEKFYTKYNLLIINKLLRPNENRSNKLATKLLNNLLKSTITLQSYELITNNQTCSSQLISTPLFSASVNHRQNIIPSYPSLSLMVSCMYFAMWRSSSIDEP